MLALHALGRLFTGRLNIRHTSMKKIMLLSIGLCSCAYAENYTLPTIQLDYTTLTSASDNNDNRGNNQIEITPKQPNQSISETLSQNSWVQSSQTPSDNPTYTMRGQRATVALNGIPLNGFSSNAQNTSLIPSNTISQVEVTSDQASVLYGSMGLGGVINIEQIFNDQDQTIIGANGNYPWGGGGNIYINHVLDQDKTWAIQLANNTQNTQTDRAYSDGTTTSTQLSLMQQTDEQSLHLSILNSEQWLHYPGALTAEQLAQDRHQATLSGRQNYYTKSLGAQLAFSQNINEDLSAKIQAQYLQQWANGSYPTSPVLPSFSQNSSNYLIRPTLNYDSGWLNAILGVEGQYQTFDNSAVIAHSSQSSESVFFQDTINITPQWFITDGARYSHANTQGDFVQYNAPNSHGNQYNNLWAGDLGLGYHWSDNGTTSFSISRAYQLPFIDQSNYTPITATGFGLDPQTALTYQLNNRYDDGILSLSNSIYWMNINNQIALAMLDDSQAYNVNLPPTQTIGMMTAIDYQLISALGLGGSFSLNYNTFRSGTINQQSVKGNQVPGTPLLSAEAHGTWQITPEWSLWLQEQYNSSEYADSDFNNSLSKSPSYMLTNAMLQYQRNAWIVSLSVNNIFNKQYNSDVTTYGDGNLYYYPAMGTNAMLSVQYQLG